MPQRASAAGDITGDQFIPRLPVAFLAVSYSPGRVADPAIPPAQRAGLRALTLHPPGGPDAPVARPLAAGCRLRTTIRPVAGLPLLHVDHPELGGFRRAVKGGLDRAIAAVALLLAPLLAVIALVIRLADGGPVLFRQTRIGKDGRPFTVLKFRTMVPDAEQRKPALAGLSDAGSVLFKIRADPRVTRTGSWLRRWSLDELPQLLNVLFGEMSLVGPRPAAGRDGEVRRPCPAPAGGQAGDHRLVAGQRAVGPVLERVSPA